MAHLIKRFLEITNNAHFSSVTSRRAARGMSFHPTSLAKCAMMVTLMMVMGVGSVWADEVEIWSGSNGGYFFIGPDNFSGKFDDATSTTTLRIYMADVGLKQFNTVHGNSILSSGNKSISAGSYYNNTDNCYEIPSTDWSASIANDEERRQT